MVLTLLLLAAQAGPATLPEMLSRAMQSLEASDRVSARRELTEALRLHPTSPAVHNFLGVVEAGDGNYLAAEKRFREAVLRAPDYTDAYLNLGRLYQENGAKDPKAATRALAAYQAILRYQPDHSEARFQSAALLQAMGEFGRSLDELRRLPPVDQDRPAALTVRLADHAGRGERAEADAAAEKLLAQGALGYLAHARALEPGNARVHFLLGMACVELDLGAEAYNSLKEAVRLDPENAAVNYAMGAVALHSKDPSEAIPYFRKYAELEPKEPRGPFALGLAAFQAKDYETARPLLLSAAERPETPITTSATCT